MLFSRISIVAAIVAEVHAAYPMNPSTTDVHHTTSTAPHMRSTGYPVHSTSSDSHMTSDYPSHHSHPVHSSETSTTLSTYPCTTGTGCAHPVMPTNPVNPYPVHNMTYPSNETGTNPAPSGYTPGYAAPTGNNYPPNTFTGAAAGKLAASTTAAVAGVAAFAFYML